MTARRIRTRCSSRLWTNMYVGSPRRHNTSGRTFPSVNEAVKSGQHQHRSG
jgi:hypothetical protein